MNAAATHVASFLFGALVTCIGWWVLADTASAPVSSSPDEQSQPVPQWVRPDCPDEAADGSQLVALGEALDEKRQQLSIAWAQAEVYTGKAREWPPDVEGRFQEEAVSGFLEASTAQSGGTLLGLDCGEYPCVATLAWRDARDSKPGIEHLSQAYPGGHGGTSSIDLGPGEGRAYVLSRAFGPYVELTPEERKRLQFRIRESMHMFPIPADW